MYPNVPHHFWTVPTLLLLMMMVFLVVISSHARAAGVIATAISGGIPKNGFCLWFEAFAEMRIFADFFANCHARKAQLSVDSRTCI